jgi:MraZ protein
MLANAYEVEIDSAGRILIPENLKTLAGLVDKVVLAGMHKRIEIWSEDVWNSVMQAAVADVDNLAGKLGELGVL